MQRPSTADILSAIRAFRTVVEADGPGDNGALIVAIFKLLETASRMKDEPCPEGDTPQFRSAIEDYKFAFARFPDLEITGQDDEEVSKETTLFPHDDLGDLYRDVREIEELIVRGHEQDARWDFRFGFEGHWGAHGLALVSYMIKTYRF